MASNVGNVGQDLDLTIVSSELVSWKRSQAL